MTRQEIISQLKQYFDIRELVCQHTYRVFGESSWQFFERDFLETLLILRRDIFKVPMNINNWHLEGKFTQRGFRCNICQLVRDKTLRNKLYLTAHANGAAFDADVKGLTAEQARQMIKDNQNLLPVNVRVEAGVSWLHLDIYDCGKKYYEFRA
jgi:hypothetical protein